MAAYVASPKSIAAPPVAMFTYSILFVVPLTGDPIYPFVLTARTLFEAPA